MDENTGPKPEDVTDETLQAFEKLDGDQRTELYRTSPAVWRVIMKALTARNERRAFGR